MRKTILGAAAVVALLALALLIRAGGWGEGPRGAGPTVAGGEETGPEGAGGQTAGVPAAPVSAPTTASTPARTEAIDSVRLVNALSVLAHDSMEGRASGSAGGARARRWLVSELEALGVQPLGEGFEHAFPMGARGTGVNLVAAIPGRRASPWIVLSAHYDHEGVRGAQVFNGADDNASGVATVLEVARVLMSEPLEHPVLVALFDDEEQGLGGARRFVSDPPVDLADIALDVNLDMVARTDGRLWAGGAYHTEALRPILEDVATRAPLDLRLGHDRPNAPEGDDWTMQSDHGAFHERGIPFVYLGVEDHPDYHRPTDDVERIDPGDFVNSARTILLALRALDAALPLPSP